MIIQEIQARREGQKPEKNAVFCEVESLNLLFSVVY